MNGTYQRKEGIVVRHVAGETILVPIANNIADLLRLFVLDPVGEFIWQHLGAPCDLAGIAEAVAASFEVEPGQALADCEVFLGELARADLVVRR